MSVVQRVWDTIDAGFVTWTTHAPDLDGVAYPGSGVFGANTSDYTVVSDTRRQSVGVATGLDVKRSPVGLWLFDGDKTDSSGNGLDLVVDTGTEQYGPAAADGKKALYCDGSTILYRSVNDASLELLADVTYMAMVKPTIVHSPAGVVCSFRAGGETEAANAIGPEIVLDSNNTLSVFWEYGAGVNETFIWTDVVVPPYQWSHIAVVRDDSAQTVTAYLNGYQVSSPWNYTNSPTGGTIAQLGVGGSWDVNSNFFSGYISSLAIVPAALTSSQVFEDALLTLPPARRL